MPAKIKDYPLYVYDDPAIYSDFSGGINSHPSNVHLQDNELRDCLNMHYASASLTKRPGAKQLCTISCEEQLFNIQGVFIFTHNVSYLILASDGKLYKGLYNENTNIILTRLPIYFKNTTNDLANSPEDTSLGLDLHYNELSNQLHSGYIQRSFVTEQGITINPNDYKVYNIITDVSTNQVITKNNILQYGNNYYLTKSNYTKYIITPENTTYWVPATSTNINTYKQIIYNYSKNNPGATSIKALGLLDKDIITYVLTDSVNNWAEQETNFAQGEIVNYKNVNYICIADHNFLQYPINSTNNTLVQLIYKDSLVFQNNKPIQYATYNNKVYITTGTRIVEIYFNNNTLVGYVITPYKCTYNEVKNLGNNLLSPYPQYCMQTVYDQVDTNVNALLPIKNKYGVYTLTPICTFANTYTEQDFCYKWEKYIYNQWVTIISFKDNYIKQYVATEDLLKEYETIMSQWDAYTEYQVNDLVYFTSASSSTKIYKCVYPHTMNLIAPANPTFVTARYINSEDTSLTTLWELVDDDSTLTNVSDNFEVYYQKQDYSTLQVIDADKYLYRVTIANEFKKPSLGDYPSWSRTQSYSKDDIVYAYYDNSYSLFKCLQDHTNAFTSLDLSFSPSLSNGVVLWEAYTADDVDSYCIINSSKIATEMIVKLDDSNSTFDATDFIIAELTGTFSQCTSTLDSSQTINTLFETIQSCSKVLLDGNKMLFYNDAYNSGSWYKTKIDNPYYITELGCLSFKTTKNEALIHCVNFSSNIIAFAYSENIGGSIHLVSGNGDDYSSDEYYSPYKKTLITETICCDNANTVQVCENYLFFKSFTNVYYIISSELSNDVINLYSANDKIKLSSQYVSIPWDDNTCISEVTEDYYALIWKEQYTLTNLGLTLVHPGLKIKLYYKIYQTINNKIYFPWLRDESKYFNIDYITYIKGKPIYLYNNLLLDFNSENTFTDLDTPYECLIHTKGVDTNYPKFLKVLSNILLYYYSNQSQQIDLQLQAFNEAGFVLLDSNKKLKSLQDLRTIQVGSKLVNNDVKLDTISLMTKTFNTDYKFPYLTVETIIKANSKTLFALSSITYIYTSGDTPDSTLYDTYTKIIRKKEI